MNLRKICLAAALGVALAASSVPVSYAEDKECKDNNDSGYNGQGGGAREKCPPPAQPSPEPGPDEGCVDIDAGIGKYEPIEQAGTRKAHIVFTFTLREAATCLDAAYYFTVATTDGTPDGNVVYQERRGPLGISEYRYEVLLDDLGAPCVGIDVRTTRTGATGAEVTKDLAPDVRTDGAYDDLCAGLDPAKTWN